MAAKIRIPPKAIPDLIAIRDLGAEQLSRVLVSLTDVRPLPLRRGTLTEIVASTLADSSDIAERLVSQLMAFYQLIKQRELESVEELTGSLRDGLGHINPAWSVDELKRWDSVAPIVGELSVCDAIRTVSKATALEYDFANLFKAGRIITDIRPVFNDQQGESLEIDGTVVSHTLRLSYDNSSGDHDLSLALDMKDIRALKLQCDRAIQKAQLAKHLASEAGYPTVVCGEDGDA